MAYVKSRPIPVGADRTVLFVIADRSDDWGQCWPNVATIAAEAAVARSTAFDSLNALVAAGLIRRERKGARPMSGKPKRGRSNLYTVVGYVDWRKVRTVDLYGSKVQTPDPSNVQTPDLSGSDVQPPDLYRSTDRTLKGPESGPELTTKELQGKNHQPTDHAAAGTFLDALARCPGRWSMLAQKVNRQRLAKLDAAVGEAIERNDLAADDGATVLAEWMAATEPPAVVTQPGGLITYRLGSIVEPVNTEPAAPRLPDVATVFAELDALAEAETGGADVIADARAHLGA